MGKISEGDEEYTYHDEHCVMDTELLNHYVVHLKLTLYVNYTSIEKRIRAKSVQFFFPMLLKRRLLKDLYCELCVFWKLKS